MEYTDHQKGVELRNAFSSDAVYGGSSKQEEWIAAVGALVLHCGKVLLVLRANSPYKGEWAVPGGRVLSGETLQQAVEREVQEETGIVVRACESILSFRVVDYAANGAVRSRFCVTDFVAQYINGEITPGDDALDAMWASPADAAQLAGHHLNPVTQTLLCTLPEFNDVLS